MLTCRDALKAAEQYAYDWGIDLPAHSSIKCAARWLLMPTEYRIEYAADTFPRLPTAIDGMLNQLRPFSTNKR